MVDRPSQIIAVEEHFVTADFPSGGRYPATLNDLGDARIEAMDRAGVDVQILSLTFPGVQGEADARVAATKAARTNDLLAQTIDRFPRRLGGFAAVALQDPAGAADELERAVRELGLHGAILNGHTRGIYLDDPRTFPLWERAEALDVPIYLHPTNPVDEWALLAGHPSLKEAAFGWGVETSGHVLRILTSGVFDHFPKARMIVGHMGEFLPYFTWRLDIRWSNHPARNKSVRRKPSEYLRENVYVATSGMFDDVPLRCALSALGEDRILFAVDHPYESMSSGVDWLLGTDIPHSVREKIAHDNARRLLRLTPSMQSGSQR